MSMLDEAEYRRLLEGIEVAETLQGSLRLESGQKPRRAIEEFLHTARERITAIEHDGEIGSGEDEKKRNQNLAMLVIVDREIRLSAQERQTFGGFLEKSFFTRDDFDELDQFYDSAYDRLSKEGKAQMSHRVWEGIRQAEYDFTDLPLNVKKKEADQIYAILSGEKPMPEAMRQIPENDKQDLFQQ